MPVLHPSTPQELGECVRAAASNGEAVYPVGGQTKLSLGNPPTKPGVALDMRRLANVVDFPARDMTITVLAGMVIRDLQQVLASEKLRLPIDVPQTDRATLGGIIAANTSGPSRYGYGTLRDYVIGISAVNDQGYEFKAGGRVVKNVAGYDLCKLMIGSLGTLGIITQATLKLRPLTETCAMVCFGCAANRIEELLSRLHGSRTLPACIELLNNNAATIVLKGSQSTVSDDPWLIMVRYDGNIDAVTWQVQQIVREIGTFGRVDARVDFASRTIWYTLIELREWGRATAIFKATMVPSAVADFCLRADAEQDGSVICAHAGNGVVTGLWDDRLTMSRAGDILTKWRERAARGAVTVTRCPSAWKSALDVWGPPPSNAWLMREIKVRFDVNNVFNPGRFLNGI